ncbi:hypothetical protein BC938DRAFT_474200 [Jimgerdemannia flammicorona]|uniref:Homeodomain-like protein n=1 Tax=Jimgerdemannia flammicorona TaxID=994334 RepID=A0A433QZJ5_9FUNG|nr:hypothetical protein BC938DRAFT_474200 [Jimgerdemannia flammicorona]
MFRFIKQSLTQFRFLTISARSPPKYTVRKAWSNEEDNILREARANGCRWQVIAQSLPDRTPNACALRFTRLAPPVARDPKPIRDRSLAWTEDETHLLREKVALYGFRWKLLAELYFPNRGPSQLSSRWPAVGNLRQNLGAWQPEEEQRLLDATQNGILSWPAIAQRVGTRNYMQCWHKYYCLAKLTKKGHFTPEENKAILDAFKQHPNDWGLIASEVSKVTGIIRSPRQCRTHYKWNLDPMLVKDPWTAQEDKILGDAYNRYGTKISAISQLLPSYRGQFQIRGRLRALKKHGIIKDCKLEEESQEGNGEGYKIE